MVVALYGNSTDADFSTAQAEADGNAPRMVDLLVRCSQIGKQVNMMLLLAQCRTPIVGRGLCAFGRTMLVRECRKYRAVFAKSWPMPPSFRFG